MKNSVDNFDALTLLESIKQNSKTFKQFTLSIRNTHYGYISFINYFKNRYKFLECYEVNNRLKFKIYKLYFYYDFDELQRCSFCGKPKSLPSLFNNGHVCGSKECSDKKYKQTCYKNHGVQNPLQSESIKQKAKQTNLSKYGVENPLQAESIKEKIKHTNLIKYGFENPSQSELIKEKKKQTSIINYGVEFPFSQNPESIQKKTETWFGKYGVTHPMKNSTVRNKNKQTCQKRYGHSYVLSVPEIRKQINLTVKERYGVEFVNQNKEIRQKTIKTNLSKYGVPYPLMNKNVRQKMIANLKSNYGVEHNSHIPECFKKMQISLSKLYIMPSGKQVYIRGYEDRFLDRYFELGGDESNIVVQPYNMKLIYFTKDLKQHRYYPDFFLIKENKIIEVKSLWTYKLALEVNLLKRRCCLDAGFGFEFNIF